MKNLIRSIYMGCLLFAFQTPVEAATIEEVLAYCRAQAEADERLACFDELARAVAEGEVLPTLPSSGTGRWSVTQKLSPIDDSRNVTMILVAEDVSAKDVSYAALGVRCMEGQIDVLVHLDSRLSVKRGINIEVLSRFDRHPAQKDYWRLSTDSKMIFAPHGVFWALRIERAQKLFVRLNPSEESPISATFDLTDTAEAMRPLRESCGFNVNAKDISDKRTALHMAMSENTLEVADFLLSHGADVNAKTEAIFEIWGGGGTALHVAVSENARGVSENALEKVGFLLKHGADVNAKMAGFAWPSSGERIFYDGWTALHSAAACNALEVASLLLSHGADVNAKDEIDRTALHWTVVRGHTGVASLLLTHGADVNAKDSDARTALDWAVKEGHTEMADLLRRHGGKK